MDDSSIDEMVTGQPSLESRGMRYVKVFVIACFAYAAICFLAIAFLLWLGGRADY
jgi:ABC-type amino acid transport system permease subunit